MSGGEQPNPTTPEQHQRVKRTARTRFDRWAASYDRSRLNQIVFFPTVRACLEEIIHWQRGRGDAPYRLLDVGCGTGNLLAILADDTHAGELVGLDFSPEMLRHAEEKFAGCRAGERLRVVHGDAEHLPFEGASFEVLTCCNSFHHYPHQPAVIREFHRVLRPGGVLILVDGFRDNVIGWFIFDVAVALVEKHVHHACWSEVRGMVAEAGFADLKQRKLNVLAPLLVNVAQR